MANKSLKWKPVEWQYAGEKKNYKGKATQYSLHVKEPNIYFYLSQGKPVAGICFWIVTSESLEYDKYSILESTSIGLGKVIGDKSIAKIQAQANDIIRKCLNKVIDALP